MSLILPDGSYTTGLTKPTKNPKGSLEDYRKNLDKLRAERVAKKLGTSEATENAQRIARKIGSEKAAKRVAKTRNKANQYRLPKSQEY